MTVEFLKSLKVEDLLEKEFPVFKEEEPISHAFSHMVEKKIFEIAVVDEKKNFLGILNYESIIRRRKIPLTSKVGHFLLSPPKLSLQDSLPDVAEMFLATDFHILPVVKSGKIVGVVRRNNLLKKATESTVIANVPLREIMSTSVITTNPEEKISSARAKMLGLDIQELPIVEDGLKLIGILEMSALLEFLRIPRKWAAQGQFISEKRPFDPKVKTVMRTEVYPISEKDTVKEAVELMNKYNISSVFVCDDQNKIVGVVNPSDILELIAKYKGRDGVHVQISGLEHEDPSVYDTIYQIVEKYMDKIHRLQKPELLNIHVITNLHHRDDTIFDVRMRLTTEKESYAMKYESWNLYEAVDKCLEHIEREIIKKKEKKIHTIRKNLNLKSSK